MKSYQVIVLGLFANQMATTYVKANSPLEAAQNISRTTNVLISSIIEMNNLQDILDKIKGAAKVYIIQEAGKKEMHWFKVVQR